MILGKVLVLKRGFPDHKVIPWPPKRPELPQNVQIALKRYYVLLWQGNSQLLHQYLINDSIYFHEMILSEVIRAQDRTSIS